MISEEKTYTYHLVHTAVTKPETPEMERTHLCFFYVGAENENFHHLSRQFDVGYRKESLRESLDCLLHLYQHNRKLPDVILMDVPFTEEDVQEFSRKINENILLSTLPLIYNEKQLSAQQIGHMRKIGVVDDIIAFDSRRINYYSKVLFLKQAKMFVRLTPPTPQKINYLRIAKSKFYFLVKRSIDITISLTAMIVLSPLFLVIAFLIRLGSKGPVFYTSMRAGSGFRVFKFYKFRTMHIDADQEVDKLREFNQYTLTVDGPNFFKVNDDPRITKIGKALRNISVDELPQLLNVLKGDMSIVGNRPLPIYEAVSLITNEFAERFSAPAGITGLWQVKKRGKKDMSNEERINLDITYSRNYTSFYDLKILVQTPAALIQKGNV